MTSATYPYWPPPLPEAEHYVVKTLISGGAGFVGSTIASACLDDGIDVVLLDNLSRGRIEFTTGRTFYHGDIAEGRLVDRIFREHRDIEAVVHCAALILVPESVEEPLRYYTENVVKTAEFVTHLQRNGCTRILLSSTAALYAATDDLAVDEESALDPQSPYARSKVMVEWMLQDIAAASDLRALSLRYFNLIGADPEMRTGLQHQRPSHLLGKLIGATESGDPFWITGVDWPTRDGTGLRDYIHIWDLAQAHVASLRKFDRAVAAGGNGYQIINLGTGTGTTVREFVEAFERVSGRVLDKRETVARPGDVVGAYTRAERAHTLLGWNPQYTLEQGIRHSLDWAAERAIRLHEQPALAVPQLRRQQRPNRGSGAVPGPTPRPHRGRPG